MLLTLRVSPTQITPALISGETKVGYSTWYKCALLCVLINILLSYCFLSVGSFAKTAQVHPIIFRQNYIDVKMDCAEACAITESLCIYDVAMVECFYGLSLSSECR